MARKIVVTSGKGGVGKTTIVANLGLQLANLSQRVVLIDVDIGLNNLDVASGIEERVVYDIVDIAEQKCRVKQALLQDENCYNLFYLPTAHIYNSGKISTKDIAKIISQLEVDFDYIIIDCPAGIDAGFYRAIYVASEAILVTTPHITSIRDADKVASILISQGITNFGLVVNRIRGDLVSKGRMLSAETIAECLNTKLLGVIPESDELCSQASISGKVFDVSKELNFAFYTLAQNIISGKIEIYNYLGKRKNKLEFFRRKSKC